MKYLIFTLSLLAFVSCKQDTKTHDHTSQNFHELYDKEAPNLYNNDWTNDIQLNEGKKWVANVETTVGVIKMKNTIKTHKTIDLEGYHQLAVQLNIEKDYLIVHCSMKGAGHENLHVWFFPLVAKIHALSEAITVEDASRLKQSISENVNAYYNYFN